jgi:hypothetical protein
MISKNLSPPHALKKLYKPFTVLTPDWSILNLHNKWAIPEQKMQTLI